MDISSGFKKVKKYIKESSGYRLLSQWTSSRTVEMDDGTTLEERIKNVDNTSDIDKPISTAQQNALDKKADLASPTLTGTPKAPTASAGTNTAQIATTAFVQTAVSDGIAASDALIFKGTIGTNGTVAELPTAYKTGWTYRVVTSGTYAGQVCETGDLIIALADKDGSDNMDSDWCVAQTNIDGAITGVKSGDAYIDYNQSGSIVTITHKDVARTDTASTASPNAGDAITVVKSVTSDEKGHVTGVDTETVTLPSTSVTVDSELSSTSENSVQNKVLYNKISNIDNTADSNKKVASAKNLTTPRTIDGISFDGTAAVNHYGVCSTGASTAAKTLTLSNFTLVTGATVRIKFSYTNTAAAPTLNVSNTGAKTIRCHNSALTSDTAGYLAAGSVYEFVYDGTYWRMMEDATSTAWFSLKYLRMADYMPPLVNSANGYQLIVDDNYGVAMLFFQIVKSINNGGTLFVINEKYRPPKTISTRIVGTQPEGLATCRVHVDPTGFVSIYSEVHDDVITTATGSIAWCY